MFVKAIKDNKGKRGGYYCSLVESKRVKGKTCHRLIFSFGYVPEERIAYLKAAFNDGNPDEILERELTKMNEKKTKFDPNQKKMTEP